MKKIILFLVAVMMMGFYSLGFCSFGFSDTKIGVLDVNKVLATIPQIKNMQANIKKDFDPRGKQVINLQNTFRNDISKFRQKNTDLKGETLKKEQQKIIDENKKLQETRLAFQRDLASAQNKAMQPILKDIETASTTIAEKQKLDVIITKTSTVFSKPAMEITDLVIAEMNRLAVNKNKKK